MEKVTVELKDLKTQASKNLEIDQKLLFPPQEESLKSELVRLNSYSSEISKSLIETLKTSELSSPDTFHQFSENCRHLGLSTIKNLDLVLNSLNSSSFKSSFLISNHSLLKSYQNLDLFESLQSSLNSLSSRCSLLDQDWDSLLISLKSFHSSLKSHSLFKDPDYPDFMTVFLSVFSSFIHVTNFYILTLSAKDFAVYVGMDGEYSGLLSAANWASAVIFTFVYSYWSNYQYKVPTFICALFVVLGDFTYFLAYPLKSPGIMLLGRLLIGVGGARVINRRYIATYVHPRARTFWNSAFVAGSIIGRGLGPYISTFLLDVNFSLFFVEINEFTAAPLLMGSVWLIYALTVLLFFQEPVVTPPKPATSKEKDSSSLLPLFVVLLALIVPKMVHEAFVTSVPLVAPSEFTWSDEKVGNFIAILSLGIAPVHIFIAYTSKWIQDREFIFSALVFTLLGSFLLIDFGLGSFFESQYTLGTVLMFIGMNMDDGVTASLLSKVLPTYMARGIFNAGLIVTFAGSSARGVGGFLIAFAGWINSSSIENLLFIPLSCFSLLALIVFSLFYRRLKVNH
jgi:MFS family permease